MCIYKYIRQAKRREEKRPQRGTNMVRPVELNVSPLEILHHADDDFQWHSSANVTSLHIHAHTQSQTYMYKYEPAKISSKNRVKKKDDKNQTLVKCSLNVSRVCVCICTYFFILHQTLWHRQKPQELFTASSKQKR